MRSGGGDREIAGLLVAIRGGLRELQAGGREPTSEPTPELSSGPTSEPSPADWHRLLRVAREHAVVPWLVRHHSHAKSLPHGSGASLQQESAQRAGLALRITGELLQVTGAMERAGVRVLAWKGPALEWQLYGASGFREYGDLDLLVRPDETDVALGVLASLGYGVPRGHDAAALLAGGHVVTVSQAGSADIEIHGAIRLSFLPRALPLDAIFERAMTVHVGSGSVLAPCPEDHLALLAIHGAKHAWGRMGWMVDVARMLQCFPELDWASVEAASRKGGYHRILLAAVHGAATLLNAPIPGELADAVENERSLPRVTRATHERWRKGLPSGRELLRYNLGLLDRRRDAVPFLARSLVTLSDADREGAPLPPGLEWTRYPARPIRLLRRYLMRREAR